MMRIARNTAVALMCTTITAPVIAQKAVMIPGETETATATIRRIDPATGYVVLGDDDGSEIGVFVPPEFKRVNELRIGDTVTITYYASIVYRVRRTGRSTAPVREEIAAAEDAAALPSATFTHRFTERVTVNAVNREAPSITVTGRDGRTVSRRVQHLSDLDGVTPGDRIDITYTEALLATVTRAK